MLKAWPLLLLLTVVYVSGCTKDAPGSDAGVVPAKSLTAKAQEMASVPSSLSPQELAVQADVKVYPGASFPDKMTKAPTGAKGQTHTYLVMSTTDKPSKVVDFYVQGSKYSELKTKDGSELQGLSPKGNLVLIDVTQAGGQTLISVKSVQGG